MIVVAIIGILAVLAIYGVSRYLKTSKTAEATNNIGAVQKNATEAMTREKGSGAYQAPGATISFSYGFCGNEANPVPKSVPAAQKYVSGAADWQVGKRHGCWWHRHRVLSSLKLGEISRNTTRTATP